MGGYWVGMAIVTHVPPIFPKGQGEPPVIGFDKVAHVVGFAGLAWLLRVVVRWPLWAIVGVGLVYGVLDEVTQPPFRRTADPLDYIADLLGLGVGLLAAIPFLRERRAGPPRPAPTADAARPLADGVHPPA